MNLEEKLSPIFAEIAQERIRQNEKWGEQNHSMVGKELLTNTDELFPSEEVLKTQLIHCRLRNNYNPGWFDILLEEVCEAFIETEPEKQREEMVQVAAVAVQIIEYLDRRIKEPAHE
jgi:hypothetical protein